LIYGFLVEDRRRISDYSDLIKFLLVCVAALPCISAFIGAAVISANYPDTAFISVYRTWVMSAGLGILFIAPLTLCLAEKLRTSSRREIGEQKLLYIILLLAISIIGVAATLFRNNPNAYLVIIFTTLPLVLWAAVRFGLWGATLLSSAVVVLSVQLAASGNGMVFSGAGSSAITVIKLQSYLISSVIASMFAGVATDRYYSTSIELRSNQNRLQLLLDTLPYGIQENTIDGIITFSNKAHHDILGLPDGYLIGKPIWHSELDDGAAEKLKEYLAYLVAEKPEPVPFETPNTRQDGQIVWLEIKWDYQLDRQGKVNGFISIISDITKRKHSETILKEELELNKSIAGISRVLLSEKNDIRKVSSVILRAAREITGSRQGFVSSIDQETKDNVIHTLTEMGRRDEYIANDQEISFHIGTDGRYEGLWGHALNTREAFFTNDPASHPSSIGVPETHVPLDRFLAYPVTNGDKLLGLIALANAEHDYSQQDIDHVKRIVETFALAIQRNEYESNRLKLQEQVLQSQKMETIGNLAGGIAHDFNNILTVIVGFSELASLHANKNSKVEEDLNEILKAGKRARDLVHQILAFARKSGDKREPIQVDLIVREVLKFIRSSLSTSIEISSDINSKSLILGNQTQVHQIVMNLCTNAAHAMEEEGGVLQVGVNDIVITQARSFETDLKKGDYIKLTVSDTGIGIAPEIINSIFDPYFTTKKQGEGSGLGLATVKGIVESYEGKIIVDSNPGEGTVFTIYLPIVKEIRSAGPDAEAPLEKGTESILVVDDEPSIVKLVGHILERLGYTVETKTDSREALELFCSDPLRFDLIITDMNMPHMTGEVLTSEVLNIRPDIPVILCTGFSHKLNRKTLGEIGARELLLKPTPMEDLAHAVRKVLDERDLN
jgi:PAS domain S-box-containing protein